MTSRLKAKVSPAPPPVASTSKGRRGNDALQASLTSLTSHGSISSSQLELALMELLNIRPDTTGIAKMCQSNPITTEGKRMQLVRMVGLTLIPVLLLSALSASLFGSRVDQFRENEEIRHTIRQGVQLSTLIHHLETERDMSALYLSSIGPESKAFLVKRYPLTDEALENVLVWDIGRAKRDKIFGTKERFANHINRHRYQLDILNVSVLGEMKFYTDLIEIFIQWYFDSVSEARSGRVWKQLVALQEIMQAKESFGMERAYGTIFFSRGGFETREDFLAFVAAQTVANSTLTEARQYSGDVGRVEEIYKTVIREDETFMLKLSVMRTFIRESGMTRRPGNLTLANEWFDNMSFYLDALLTMQKTLIKQTEVILEASRREGVMELSVLTIVFVLVVLLCPITLHSVYMMTSDIQNYSISLVDRTRALNKEKRRTDSLLYQLLPKTVAEQLKNNEEISAESFQDVSIFFSDIVGFTDISSRSSPIQVVQMLNDLYTTFDARIEMYDVFKVETIGDAYMVVSGLPRRNGNRHAAEVCTLALDITDHIKSKVIQHMPSTHFRLRVGVHSGPVIAGVVGKKMPRYCLFGETVKIAEKMEASAPAGNIHISQTTYASLQAIGGFVMTPRTDPLEDIDMKTFYLVHRQGMQRPHNSPKHPPSTESDLSMTNVEVYTRPQEADTDDPDSVTEEV